MRSSTVLAGFFVSAAFLVTGCDDLKDKLGMGDKKEAASKDDKKEKKKKSGDEEETEEEGSAKPAASGSPTTAPASPTPTPTTPAGPLGAPGKAGSHLPADCDAVATMNIAKILGHQAFASKVVPAIDEAMKKATTEGKDAPKVDAFLKETAISPKAVSDVALCIKNASPEPVWGVIVAGSFTPDSVVPALEKADGAEFKGKIKDVDGRRVISDDKATLGQYSDASIGLAATVDLWKSLAATGDNATSKYKLDGAKDIMISLPEGSVAKFAQGEPQLASVKSATISLDLSSSKFMARIATTSAEEAKKLDAVITLLKSQAGSNMADMPPGTAELLKALTTRVEGNDLIMEANIPAESINALAALIAEGLKEQSSAVSDMFPAADPKAESKTTKPGTSTPTKPGTKPLLRRPGGLRFPSRK